MYIFNPEDMYCKMYSKERALENAAYFKLVSVSSYFVHGWKRDDKLLIFNTTFQKG